MTEHPDSATLKRWHAEYQCRAHDAYATLVASYTPEQRELVRQMNHARRQATLCADRYRKPESKWGRTLAWPKEPPA